MILKERKQVYYKLPLGILIIILIGLSPIIVALIGSTLSEFISGTPCNEGNCAWMALIWLALLSIPASFVGIIVYIVLIVNELSRMKKHSGQTENEKNI